MPELPEVEVLARHLHAALIGLRILDASVLHPKICRPTAPDALRQALVGRTFREVNRRGKYLLFHLGTQAGGAGPAILLGHLGMTGRMFVQPAHHPLPRHAVAHLTLDRGRFVFQDARLFGRLNLDLTPLTRLGPEPLGPAFTINRFQGSLGRSRQAIKVRLLDQSTVAGIGNIYASESLFRARIHPARQANRLRPAEVVNLRQALRRVVRDAITQGSTVPLNWSGQGTRDRLFYYGRKPGTPGHSEERLSVYDREGEPCPRCRTSLRRLVQGARSTFFCPACQRR